MSDAYQTSGNSPTVFEPLLDDGQAGEMLGLHWALLALSGQCP